MTCSTTVLAATWTAAASFRSAARASTTSRTSIVDIPRDQLVVITGLSGSGKSSLAFDTIYAEGQRRYVEIPVGLRPPVPGTDGQAGRRPIEGLSPAISIEQKTTSQEPALHRRHGDRNPRLHAPAVGARRRPLFARDRPADRGADRLPDGRPGAWRCRRARGCCCWRPWCATARASTARNSPSSCKAGLHAASRSTARSTRLAKCPRWTGRSSTRSRRWWTASWCARHRAAPGRQLRDRAAPCRRHRW